MHYFFLGVTMILPADLEGVTALVTVLCLGCAATVFTAALAGVEPFTGVTLDFAAGAVTFTSFTDFTTGAVAANALVEPPTILTTLLFLSI